MRFRVALLAVLVFAVVDVAQGLGLLGGESSAVVQRSALSGMRFTELPASTAATDAATPTTSPPLPAEPPTTVTALPPPAPSVAPSTAATPSTTKAPPPDAVVARVVASSLAVFHDPSDPTPSLVLPSRTEFGNPRILLATQARDGWVQVMLPVRPNGSVGWVKAQSVTLSSVPDVLDVDVNAHTLTWGRRGDIVMSVKVATGAPSSPTPLGTYYVTDVLREDPSGALGAWVLALDGHSDTFTEFEGGDARIAIHGTNDPSSIGRAASFGCVRVDATSLAQLAAAIAPGTPVVIH